LNETFGENDRLKQENEELKEALTKKQVNESNKMICFFFFNFPISQDSKTSILSITKNIAKNALNISTAENSEEVKVPTPRYVSIFCYYYFLAPK
jgi:hypothetical protein